MARILILGGTGVLGFPIATALRRAGHIVEAIVRDPSKEKAKELERQEVGVFQGDIAVGTTWVKHIAGADVIIDVTDAKSGPGVFKIVLDAAKTRPKGAPKQTFVYTSGQWNHGDTRRQVTDRSILPGPDLPPKIVTTWRPDFENFLLSQENRAVLDVIIIRPANVYGGSSATFATWFEPLINAGNLEVVKIPGKADALIPTVHKDDLAAAYCLIVDKSSVLSNISYPVFDVAGNVESLHQILSEVAIVLGVNPSRIRIVKPTNDFVEGLTTTAIVISERVRDLAGWQPRHSGITVGMETYMNAYFANKSG